VCGILLGPRLGGSVLGFVKELNAYAMSFVDV
jgi:hypothetical protein